MACKLLPCLSFALVDLDRGVRENAFKAVHGILERLEKAHEIPELEESEDSTEQATIGLSRSSLAVTAGSQALAHWAASALAFSTLLLQQASNVVQTSFTTPASTNSPESQTDPAPIDTVKFPSASASLESVTATTEAAPQSR
ncbi:unnamed protein product [Protopolystoma xenopodis]|uniref:Uncharacterized protein n=1 Tax=Protopolystoma xenopodis TaxID=117903 RepID=A0A448X621_9PLAT|nr:unnamed protein product [Protopolystoma xenopodis]